MDDERLPGAPEDDEDYEPDLMTLEDEDGVQHTFEVLDATDVGGVRYLAVVPYRAAPADKLESDSEMLIMRAGEENGEEYLDVVDDDEELLSIGSVFVNRLREVYDIDLDDLRE